MTALPHSIGAQRLSIQVPSEELARALLPRIDDIQRRRVVPVIEQVIDELAPAGVQIKLTRVQVDLGTLPFSHFEEVLVERLRGELRQALGDAMRAAREAPSPEARAQPEGVAWLDLLEHYLCHGTLPFWAPRRAPFSFEAQLLERVERDPEGLSQLLRKHRGRPTVLERIVLQLGAAALARLLHVLEPEGATLILAYLVDLRDLHQAEPLVALAEEPFDRVLWVLVLTYVLRDPGSQFNRKSFVLSLLVGLANSEGIELESLVAALRLGLEQTSQHLPLRSSFPAVLGEVFADLDRRQGRSIVSQEASRQASPYDLEGDRTHEGNWDTLEHYLLYGAMPPWAQPRSELSFEALMLRLLEADPDRVGRLVRRHGEQQRTLERIVFELGEESLGRLLHALTPESAALIVAYLVDLRKLHRAEPLIELSPEAFSRRLWALSLRYVVHDPGSQFNRKSFVLSLLVGLANSEGIELASLVAALRLGLEQTEQHLPLRSSFPAVLGEVFADLDRQQGRGIVSRESSPQFPLSELEEDRVHGGGWAILEHYLLYGATPTWAQPPPELSFEALVLRLLEADPDRVSLLVRRYADLPHVLERIVRQLEEESLSRLLRALTPESAALIVTYHVELRELHRTEPLIESSAEAFRRQLWALSLRYVLRDPGSQFNRKSFVLSLLVGLANSEGIELESLVAALRLSLQQTGRHLPLSASFPAFLGEIFADLDRQRRGGEDIVSREAPRQRSLAELEEDETYARRWAILEHYLCDGVMPPWTQPRPELSFEALVLRLLEADPDRVGRLVHRYAEQQRTLERIVFELDEEALGRLLHALTPESIALIVAYLVELREPRRTAPLSALSPKAFVRQLWVLSLLERDEISPAWKVGLSSEDALLGALPSRLGATTAELSAAIARHLTDDRVCERWAKLLPEAALVRLSARLAPSNHLALIDAAELLSSAWTAVAPPGQRGARGRHAFWSVLLAIFAQSAGAELSVEQLTLAFFEHFAVQSQVEVPAAGGPPAVGQGFFEQAQRLASNAGNAALKAALQHRQAALLALWTGARKAPAPRASASEGRKDAIGKPPPPGAPPRRRDKPVVGKTAFRFRGADAANDLGGEAVYIDNAGLVLAGPFLPHLLRALDMLGQDEKGAPRLRDRETAGRAVHLLSYLCDGHADTPEPSLVLAKVLCGVPTGAAVARKIELTASEREACERLLRSMIAHWAIIANTSIAGLRETFMQREGKLTRAEDRWLLRVQRKTVDVLVDQIPWSISVVYHPWMPEPLHVTW